MTDRVKRSVQIIMFEPAHLPRRVSTYSENIEISRGIAALAVVLFHCWIWYISPGSTNIFAAKTLAEFFSQGAIPAVGNLTFGLGFLGVNLFFVVSGFCIHVSRAARENPPLRIKDFLIKRFLRIYPLYLAMVVFLFWYYGPVLGYYAEKGITAENFLGHLAFWHYAGHPSQAGMGISVIMWTIAIEVEFYLLYAVTYPLLVRVGIGRAALFFLALEIAYRIAFPIFEHQPMFTSPSRFAPMRFGEWLLGAWLAELYVAGKLRNFGGYAALGGVGTLIAGILVGSAAGWGKYDSTDVPAAICVFAVLGWLLQREQRRQEPGVIERHLRAVGVWLGRRCYSIYMVHVTSLSLSLLFLRHFIQTGSVSLLVSQIAVALIVSDLVYRLIEVPSHNLSRRFGKPKQALMQTG